MTRAVVLFDGASGLPTYETERLRLRMTEPRDAPGLLTVFGDPEVARFLSRPAFTELAQAEAFQVRLQACFRERSYLQWGIARRTDDVLIGTFTLFHVDLEQGRGEIGYTLQRDHWGQGLAGEAVGAMIGVVFGELGLRRLEADVDPRNTRSLALLEKLGFVREGLLRERFLVNGELQDTVLLGLLSREWQARAR